MNALMPIYGETQSAEQWISRGGVELAVQTFRKLFTTIIHYQTLSDIPKQHLTLAALVRFLWTGVHR